METDLDSTDVPDLDIQIGEKDDQFGDADGDEDNSDDFIFDVADPGELAAYEVGPIQPSTIAKYKQTVAPFEKLLDTMAKKKDGRFGHNAWSYKQYLIHLGRRIPKLSWTYLRLTWHSINFARKMKNLPSMAGNAEFNDVQRVWYSKSASNTYVTYPLHV